MGACITQRGQRSNTENDHCRYTHSRSDGRGGGYPPSVNTAHHSFSHPSPFCLFTANGKSVVAMETQLWVASRPSLPAVTVVSLPRWAQRAAEKKKKKQQLDTEARRKLLLFPSFFYQQSLFLLFTVKCISCEVQTQLVHIELQENACKMTNGCQQS